MRTVKRFGLPSVVVALLVTCGALLVFTLRETAGQSSDDWRQLSLTEFVQEMEGLTSGEQPVTDALWAEIHAQSAERLLAAVANNAPADYGDLVRLYLWAKPNLTAQQASAVLASLTPDASQTSTWSFAKLQAVHTRMQEAEMPTSSVEALPLSWLEGRDVRTISDVDQLAWLTEQVQLVGRDDPAPTAFTVTWTGTIQAPANGQYTFSTCPLDMNVDQRRMRRSQTMKVSIGGQQVLDSAISAKSSAVTMVAGQQKPVQIDFSYSCADAVMFASRPAVAVLYWEKSGVSKRLVPESALVTPDGSRAGLEGRYTFTVGENEETITRVDKQVNFIWHHGSELNSPHQALREAVAGQLYTVARSAGTLASWESESSAQQADWPGTNWAFLESLEAQEQATWAQTLLAHPVLLEDCSRQDAVDLYRTCRVGAAADALRLVGSWAQAHAEEPLSFSADFYSANRAAYRNLAYMLAWEDSEQLEMLEEDYLSLPTGGCALPVAQTLAYGYWTLGRVSEWIEKLEAVLSDEQLTGDARVTWLVARAQAEEIRRSRSSRYSRTADHYLAGQEFLQEACLVATSEPVRLWAFGQWAARFTANENLQGARDILAQAGERCTSSQSTDKLAEWSEQLAALSTAFAARHQKQEALARDAYIARLRTRRQRALDGGDSAAASRYDQLLSDAGATE